MRIVLATETFLPHIDGIVTRLTHTITNLRRAGDDVLVVAPWRPNSPPEFMGARVLTVPSMALPLYKDVYLGLPVLPPQIEKAISDFRPDIMHAVSPSFLGLGLILSARRRGIPLVGSYHVQYPEYVARYNLHALVPFIRWYLRTVHNRAALNLATSLPMVHDLRARGFRHMQHWRAGVDATMFHPSKANAPWRRDVTDNHPSDFILICVARLAIEKEIERLIPVLQTVPRVRLVIVGDGPAQAYLHSAFAGLPVVFTGMIRDKNELAAAYASADAFVLPSSTETLGLVALEAMAAGIPAVVANRGGLPDLVINGITGYLYDPDDPNDLAAHILALQQAPDLRVAMAAAARSHAEQFSWEKTTTQLRHYYAALLKPNTLLTPAAVTVAATSEPPQHL